MTATVADAPVATTAPPAPTTPAPAPKSTGSLQTFGLDDLARYTREGEFGPNSSPDFRVFYVGRDDVHGVLMHLFSRVRLSVKMNMFGYDDDELNALIFGLAQDPAVMVSVTLDKSQAGGVHEKKLLSSDAAQNPDVFAADFVVGESETAQISHTKGAVLDGLVAFEGSTNWSASGEGIGIALGSAQQASGFKAQNNTLAVYVNAYEVAKFATRLDYEHAVAARRPQPSFIPPAPAAASPPPAPTTPAAPAAQRKPGS